MFKCEACKNTTKPGETCTQVVVEWRKKSYSAQSHMGPKDKFGSAKMVSGRSGEGYEAVRSVKVCPDCIFNGAVKPVLIPETSRQDGVGLSPVSTGLSTAPVSQPVHKYISRHQSQEAAA